MGYCDGFCTANTYRLDSLIEHLQNEFECKFIRETLHVFRKGFDAFLFPYGVAVIFSEERGESQSFSDRIQLFEEGRLYEPISDEFTYEVGRGKKPIIHEDHITLPGNEDIAYEKIAVAHGIAQSLKLSWFEEEIIRTIDESRHIPENLVRTGSARLPRGKLASLRGTLFLTKSRIILQFDLLDTPEFFWERPELDPLYSSMHGYLEITQRMDILNRKLEVIHELFEMLADEQKHNHSSRLEWIIIWLIAAEIFFFLVHDIFKLF